MDYQNITLENNFNSLIFTKQIYCSNIMTIKLYQVNQSGGQCIQKPRYRCAHMERGFCVFCHPIFCTYF